MHVNSSSALTTPDAAVVAAGAAETAPDGESRRFERLYRAEIDRVYRLCLHMCGDPVRAGELVQDVFVKVWDALNTLRDESSARAWVRRIAANVVYNDTRSRRRRLARVTLHDDLAPDDPLGQVSLAPFATPPVMRGIDLRAAIDTLPPRTRAIYLLHDVEGYGSDEIAEQLGIVASTVRVQVARARGLLRRALSA